MTALPFSSRLWTSSAKTDVLKSCFVCNNSRQQSLPFELLRPLFSLTFNKNFSNSSIIRPTTAVADAAAEMIRLSKRMSELDLCSRREADEYITQNRVFIRGKRVLPILGQKVLKTETNIRIDYLDRLQRNKNNRNESMIVSEKENNYCGNESSNWERRRGDTIVLHKPIGYVSGQPDMDHGHIPAVRLLTRVNLHLPSQDRNDILQTVSSGHYFHFHRKSLMTNDIATATTNDSKTTATTVSSTPSSMASTLMGYVPAGRLDLDSSGLLIFTKCGVMAKKLTRTSPTLSRSKKHQEGIEKEYRVYVEPVQSITRYERESLHLRGIPHPTKDLSIFLKGGRRLWNDPKPLKPLIVAEWLSQPSEVGEMSSRSRHRSNNHKSIEDNNTSSDPIHGNWKGILRLVLKEGKKHQIRRMCREILGLHVSKLVRVRIGNIELEDLPEGKWRPLREREFDMLLNI